MNIKESAIKSCEARIKHLQNAPPYYHGKRQRLRAIELEKVKIAALTPPTQAQMERVWPGCDNCTAGDGEFRVYCDKWGPDDYCGLCGRPLTPKAWEELRKRLEMLNVGKGD